MHLPYHYSAQAQQPATQQEAVPPDRAGYQTVRQAVMGDVASGQDGENQDVEEQHPALQRESLPPDRVYHHAVRQPFLPSLKQLEEMVTMGTEEELHYPVHLPYHYCAQAQQPATQQEAVTPDRHQMVRQAGMGDVAQGQEGENQGVE